MSKLPVNIITSPFRLRYPLHALPALDHLPLGLWTASLLTDLLFMMDGDKAFAFLSYFCILIGLISALLAAANRIFEFVTQPPHTPAKRLATTQLSLNLLAVILFLFNFFARHGLENGIPTFITRGELVLSSLSVALLAISGHLSGLSFNKGPA